MRKVHSSKLREGMVLSKPIYTSNGIILLMEGTQLTGRYIEKIINTGLQYIYIQDEVSKGIQLDDLIKEETKIETKKVLQESLKKIKSGYYNVGGDIIKKVEKLIKEVILNPLVIISIQEIRNKSEYLHMHSINVCVLSCLLGKKMKYSDIQLKHLATGALLHDVGKVNLQFDCTRYREDYIEKEFAIYKKHVEMGYEMVQAIPDTSLYAANIIKMHHENYDGTGFPLGLKGEAIHEFAMIVAIANEYDNLLYNQPIGSNLKHYEIIEVIMAKAFTVFHPEVVKVFMSTISPYPLGSGVVLSDGKIGIVSSLNPNFPTRPIVRIIDQDNMKIIEEIDLSKNTTLLITDEKDIDK